MTRKNVLLVDDKEINRMMLKNMFGGEYNVLEAVNGEEAVKIIKERGNEISVILLDIIMPVMDGFGVLDFMKKENLLKKIPVMLITTDDSSETENKSYSYEIADLIRKPFVPGTVQRRMNNIIELYEARNNPNNNGNSQPTSDDDVLKLEHFCEVLRMENQELKSTTDALIEALSCIVEFRNNESKKHIKRIKCLTMILAQSIMSEFPEYGLDLDKVLTMTKAAALHDVGKIGVPDAVLLKPGRLTPEEFEEMKKHSIYGARIIETFDFLKDKEMFEYSYKIARWHHERFDGKGYPDALKGEDIPICAQIVGIADVYEALVSKRIYKDAYSHLTACRMIVSGECGSFNPKVLQCFDKSKEDFRIALLEYQE